MVEGCLITFIRPRAGPHRNETGPQEVSLRPGQSVQVVSIGDYRRNISRNAAFFRRSISINRPNGPSPRETVWPFPLKTRRAACASFAVNAITTRATAIIQQRMEVFLSKEIHSHNTLTKAVR